jgi:hypothetical protein
MWLEQFVVSERNYLCVSDIMLLMSILVVDGQQNVMLVLICEIVLVMSMSC